jgi:hypothetical protein
MVASKLKREDFHGMTGSPEYRSWARIKSRCFNPNSADFPDYGGRGITMSQEWRDSFPKFYEHIGPKPSDGKRYSVDRVDNTKGYVPDNVRWATDAQQARNQNGRSKANTTGVTGVYWDTKVHPTGRDSTRYAVAQWVSLEGVRKKKCFSVKKLGEELAFLAACECRDKQMTLLNLQGAGYTDQHLNNRSYT